MTSASRALASVARMRILALPLTSGSSTTGKYTYYHVQMPPRKPEKEGARPSLLKRATGKAAELWTGFGKAPEGSWKNRTFKYGEKIMDQIEFEELALKNIDPSLGPKLRRKDSPHMTFEEAKRQHVSIPLIHPGFFANSISPLQHLQTLLQKRAPAHRKGFYFWMLISPLTAPFMLIPIIPNLPFFFCVWRSYHHYRAYKSSEYLEGLLEEGAIEPEPDMNLDKIYKDCTSQLLPQFAGPAADLAATSGSSSKHKQEIILSKEAISKIIAEFHLSAHAEADLLRALDQTSQRLKEKKDA